MKKALMIIIILLLLPAALAFQGSKLDVTELVPLETGEELTFVLEINNKNTHDARDIIVTFDFSGEKVYAHFPDLNTGERTKEIITIKRPEGIEGKYGLNVYINNEDLHYQKGFNFNSEETVLATLVVEDKTELTIKGAISNKIDSLLKFIFGN